MRHDTINFMEPLSRISTHAPQDGTLSVVLHESGEDNFINHPKSITGKHSLYEIGSITKVFTAIALLILEHEEKIRRHDTLEVCLPEVNFSDSRVAGVTLVQLTSHTSGLPKLPDNMNPENSDDPYADYTEDDLYQFLSRYELENADKTTVSYSNLGYGLLGHILARADGGTLGELLEERILAPLGMKSSYILTPSDKPGKLMPGHTNNGKPVSNWHLGVFAGAGGIVSNAADMSSFLQAQLYPSDDLLGSALKRSREVLAESKNGKLQHCFGWVSCRSKAGSTVYWHNGQTGGYQSFMGFSPEENRGFVAMANYKLDLDKLGIEYFGL